ncbi:YidC/Oxa1 family membrane protein insertase [Risungbinella massiliensis]|uniref:YidC/Oxa1 family membrane protein insertase n=1 Tax=Risungbinella massiliensis TaxID=1329796 RepID=UPI0005CC00E5|nr:YidC/Oxa1 family membrane protein insertase [Risungbinella massiliensis]
MFSWLDPIIKLLDELLQVFFSVTGDWGFAIILLTILIRSILFATNLKTARQQVKMARIQPLLSKIRENYAKDSALLFQKTSELYSKYGVKPVSFLWIALVQAPIFLSLYQLFTSHGFFVSTAILPWIDSLHSPDPLHITPIVYAVVSLIASCIPLTSEAVVASSMLQRAGFPMLISIIFLFVMWSAPVAIGLYWISNSIFTIVERGFYRTAWGKKLLYKEVTTI